MGKFLRVYTGYHSISGFAKPPGRHLIGWVDRFEVCYFFFFLIPSGGWGKIKPKLTTLPRIFIRVVCRFNSVAFETQR